MTGRSTAKARRDAERITAALESISERATKPRQEIAERLIGLAASGAAFTADELFADMRASGSGIGRATIYRTIEKLVELRLIDRVDFADGDRWYRVCSGDGHHHHLTCRECHKVVEVELCLPEEKLLALGIREHFTIEEHEISLFGICDECRRRQKSPRRREG
jgi:Fe2+/Zn2+ uptake regulation proteins